MEGLSLSKLPEGPQWVYEIKLDGHRAEAIRTVDGVQFYSRNGKSLNKKFPYIVEALGDLPLDTIVDGEWLRWMTQENSSKLIDQLIFARERRGAPLNLANLVRREMTEIVDKREWHGWHAFRRGLATRLHEAHVQVEVIQEISRHTDPKVTQNSYIVVKSNATTKAVRKVGANGLLKAWKEEQPMISDSRKSLVFFVVNWACLGIFGRKMDVNPGAQITNGLC